MCVYVWHSNVHVCVSMCVRACAFWFLEVNIYFDKSLCYNLLFSLHVIPAREGRGGVGEGGGGGGGE